MSTVVRGFYGVAKLEPGGWRARVLCQPSTVVWEGQVLHETTEEAWAEAERERDRLAGKLS